MTLAIWPCRISKSKQLDKLEAAGQHLLETINTVLDLSKIEAGKLVIEQTPFRLGSLFENVCSMLQDKAIAKKLQLLVELNRSGKTILIATHDLNLIRAAKAQVPARVLRIRGGQVQVAGAEL